MSTTSLKADLYSVLGMLLDTICETLINALLYFWLDIYWAVCVNIGNRIKFWRSESKRNKNCIITFRYFVNWRKEKNDSFIEGF